VPRVDELNVVMVPMSANGKVRAAVLQEVAPPNPRMQPTSASEEAPCGRQVPMMAMERSDCAGAALVACS
jgi:hypothetical protein